MINKIKKGNKHDQKPKGGQRCAPKKKQASLGTQGGAMVCIKKTMNMIRSTKGGCAQEKVTNVIKNTRGVKVHKRKQ
jgi:hypothetical protein